jgi:hypothetical protein
MASETTEQPSPELPQVDTQTKTKYLMVFVDFLFGDQSKTVNPTLIKFFELEEPWLDELEKRRLIRRRSLGSEQVEIAVTPLGKQVASVQRVRLHNEQRAAGEVVPGPEEPPTLASEVLNRVMDHPRATSLAGLSAGILLVVGGLLLFYLGATGRFSWTAHLTGLANVALDLFVGGALVVFGVFLAWATRFAVRMVAPLEG